MFSPEWCNAAEPGVSLNKSLLIMGFSEQSLRGEMLDGICHDS